MNHQFHSQLVTDSGPYTDSYYFASDSDSVDSISPKFSSPKTKRWSPKYDSSSELSLTGSRSPVLGVGMGNNKLEPRKLSFTDSSFKTPVSHYLYLLVFISLLFVLIFNGNYNVSVRSVGFPSNTTAPQIDAPETNWWEQYNTKCCIIDKNLTRLHGRADCKADGVCYNYLSSWLGKHKQDFYSSPWSQSCCYDFRPIGEKQLHTFCSYTCLNTQKNSR